MKVVLRGAPGPFVDNVDRRRSLRRFDGVSGGAHIQEITIGVEPWRAQVDASGRRSRRPVQGDADVSAWAMLRQHFPQLECAQDDGPRQLGPEMPWVELDLGRWIDPRVEIYVHDQIVRAPTEPFGLRLVHSTSIDPARAALEVLIRYQGLLRTKNEHSAQPVFEGVLRLHRGIHDVSKPLVEADYHHGLDTWQWVLRLDPEADLALQAAALFHDVERLLSEADCRIEHHASDYARFKRAHARGGAAFVAQLLGESVPPSELRRIVWLVGHHEHGCGDPQVATLNDADALSFFSLNSTGFLDYYGLRHTEKKVRYTLNRLRSSEWWRLTWFRMPREVRSMVQAQMAATGRFPPPNARAQTWRARRECEEGEEQR
jgi:hypothetical protein